MEICRKKLTKTDVKHKMSWPIRYMNQLEQNQGINLNNPPNKVEFEVVDQVGRPWKFVCTRRTKGHKKPAITGQWLQFVKFYNLQIDDQVIFLNNPNNNGVPFCIRFQRQAP